MIQEAAFTSHSFKDIWQNLSSKLTINELVESATLAKLIWQRRNDSIHQKGFSHPNVLIKNGQEELSLYNQGLIDPPT